MDIKLWVAENLGRSIKKIEKHCSIMSMVLNRNRCRKHYVYGRNTRASLPHVGSTVRVKALFIVPNRVSAIRGYQYSRFRFPVVFITVQ